MLEGLPLLKKVLLETPPAPAALSARPTPPSAPRPPPATATTSQGPPMSSDRSEPKPAKRTNLLFCSLRGTSKSHQSRNSVQMRAPGWTEEQMVTRDDVSPTSPTQISGFLSLKKHKTKARPTLPQTEASDFTSEMYLTIRRRKSERGRNYNPMDPAHQQTSFRGTAPIKHTRTIRLDENPDRTSLTPDIRPRVPRSHPLPQEGPFDPL
uniref:Expressed protein n=1 Tax=Echinococcus granulosus TaxID=6210 RepID=A0A068WZF2_ECHGR|nr:expressed protein [Echinococcus granulosus]